MESYDSNLTALSNTCGDFSTGYFQRNGFWLVIKTNMNVNYFVIAGADKRFVLAKARFTGDNTVEIFADNVKNPVAVCFAWSNNPGYFNLYNQKGLPANPFRTDDWPSIIK